MKTGRMFCRAVFLATALAASVAAVAAPPQGPRSGGPPGGSSGYGAHRPAHPGGGHYGYGHGHHAPAWSWGVAIGVPWALGWYDPYWWGSPYYPYYAYRPAYPDAPYGCGLDEGCWRAQQAQSQPAPPTTEVSPLASGAEGGPTERPLHRNYCDSARAWFPQVRTCPGGWRMVQPEYNPVP